MTALSISVGEEMNPTRRNTMEDSHVVLGPGTWKSPDPNMTYISVHDGHGG
jgi:serine/threonine protein phosphatase PrpC